MRKAAVLLAGVVGLGCVASRAAPPSVQAAPAMLVVVHVKTPLSPRDARALRSARDVAAVLPRTTLEVWRIAKPAHDSVARLRTDPRIAFVEAMVGETIAAVPVESEEAARLSADDREATSLLTRGAPPETFRITAARPLAVTMDLMESPLAGSLAVPLLGRERPVFTRTSIVATGTDGLTWHGREANGVGEATFVVRPLGITGTLRYDDRVYSVWPLGSGRHLVSRTESFPPDHPRRPR